MAAAERAFLGGSMTTPAACAAQARPRPRARTARLLPRRLHRGTNDRAWLHHRRHGRTGPRRKGFCPRPGGARL